VLVNFKTHFPREFVYQHNWLGVLQHLLTLRIIATSILIFICYFAIGLQLAVVPGFVHLELGYNPVVAGLAISVQYLATLLSRPVAGRMSDAIGAKRTTLIGLLARAGSGLVFVLSAWLVGHPILSLSVLILCRLILGFGESWIATGATLWGIGRVGAAYTAQVISWSGIASFGALAAGAPSGIWLGNHFGLSALGVVTCVAALMALMWAFRIPAIPILQGKTLGFTQLLSRVFPYGLGLALGGIGFGTIASFVTLYYANRHWQDAGLSLSLFGVFFVAARLLFANSINKWGGYRVAIVSLACESIGLILFWLAWVPTVAHVAAVLAGFGFSLVFPSLGVEAVKNIPAGNSGAALGVYTAFIDLSLGVSGPIAGAIAFFLGYPSIFLFAGVMAGSSTALVMTLYSRVNAKNPANPRPMALVPAVQIIDYHKKARLPARSSRATWCAMERARSQDAGEK
jgi:MFS family permease